MYGRYRSAWLTVWGAVATIFMCVGFMVLPLRSSIVVVVLAGAVASIAMVTYHCRDGADPKTRLALVRIAAASASAGGGLTLALVGLGVVGAIGACLVLLISAISSPWALGNLWSRLGPRDNGKAWGGGVPEAALDLDPDPVSGCMLPQDYQALSDRELCRVWRVSFCALQDARTALAKERIFTLRHAYLQELERRDPDAIRAWLAAGARAAGGPEKFLTLPPDEGHLYAS
jgi:hypothetical protein